MPTNAPSPIDFSKDVFFLSPEIVLTVWGLLVLLVDVGLAHRLSSGARRRTIGSTARSASARALSSATAEG